MATIEEAAEEANVNEIIEPDFSEGESKVAEGVTVTPIYTDSDSGERAAKQMIKAVRIDVDKTIIGVDTDGFIELSATFNCIYRKKCFYDEAFRTFHTAAD